MEALAALSLAGTIIQVVDFGWKIFTTTHELYKSTGNVTIFQQCELVTADLHRITQRLEDYKLQSSSKSPASATLIDDDSLQTLLNESSDVTSKLLARFEKLRVHGKKTKYKSFCQAVKSAFSESDIRGTMRQLSEMRSAIQMHLVVDLRAQLHTLTSTQSSTVSIDQATRDLITALSSHEDKLEAQGIAIAQLLGKIDLIAQDQARTLAAVNQIERAKSTASWKEVKKTTFLDSVISSSKQAQGNPGGATRQLDMNYWVTEELLCQLSYPAIKDREEAILEAHQETFKWILSDRSPLGRRFVNWLRQGHGVYWINGKAASGKSTLMKYIFQEPEVHSLLEEWAGNDNLITGRFYFWLSGAPEQRSQIGLLRSLLHEIILQDKTLTPVLFPVRWARIYSDLSRPFSYRNVEVPDPWSLAELTCGFEKLAHQGIMHKKVCLIIDGLDEYEGDHHDIAEFFQNISACRGIKACLSSRPLLAFKDVFGPSPSFRLQDFTYEDIKAYVTATLTENRYFCVLSQNEPEKASELIKSVLQRSDGVFLWVRLVIASLMKGLGNRDTIKDLQERLSVIPDDLGDLYDNMLNSIEPLYQERAAKVFQLIEASQLVESTWKGRAVHIGWLDTFSAALALRVSPESVPEVNQLPASEEGINHLCQQMEDQLKVYCAGLVETTGYTGRVGYIHRSVRDYLRLARHGARVSTWATRGGNWDPHTAMLESFVLQSFSGIMTGDRFLTLGCTALCHARYDSGQNPQKYITILRIFGEKFTHCLQAAHGLEPDRPIPLDARYHGDPRDLDQVFPLIAVKWSLVPYMEQYLKNLHLRSGSFEDDLDMFCRAALRYNWDMVWPLKALFVPDKPSMLWSIVASRPPSPAMISLLLKHGFNPGRRTIFSYESPWHGLLARLVAPPTATGIYEVPYEWFKALLDVLTLLLDHGASLNYFIVDDEGEYLSVRVAINKKARAYNAEYADKLDELFALYGGKVTVRLSDKLRFWRRMRIRHECFLLFEKL
ncbi:hypothetical protein BJX68DRAFT_267612 [Aspergillus pseudodeflectus]|uniref:NACHT domain-containing protein n=1 Tax=Aspergillus pseudodeflectus TaxID=176178 RepID=A0ABR4K8Z5_9EURO